MPTPSLRLRLTLVYAAGVSVTLIVVLVALNQALARHLVQQLDQQLTRGTETARILATNPDPPALDHPAARPTAATLIGRASAPLVIVIRAADGRVSAAVPVGFDAVVPSLPSGRATITTADGLRLRVRTEALTGGGAVQAAEPLTNVDDTLRELRRVMLLASALMLPVVALLAWALAGRGLRPLDEVIRFAEQVGEGHLDARLPARHRPLELRRLAEAVDAMVARLEATFQRQRRFLGDVSHELRTPLTALRGGIDVLLMQPDLTVEAREQLDEMSEECGRLIRLTQNLLALAQAEAGRDPFRTPVALDQVCLEAIQLVRPLRRDVAIGVRDFEPALVPGDPDLLRQLVVNLLENAVRHSPAGGRVTLELTREPMGAVIDVLDQGPGIAPADLPHVFERFYQGAARRPGTPGMGLGLAIVRWIASAHGGEVSVRNRQRGGARFSVTLPDIEHARRRPAPDGSPPTGVPEAALSP